jgi:predicted DNA-binding protein
MLSVRLGEALESQLYQVSQVHNTTKTDIIKNALVLYFDMIKDEKKSTPYSLGKELFGRYGSGKENLSTTYKQVLKEKINAKYNHR